MPEFEWTEACTSAAQMVAMGELSFEQIAAKVGVHRQTIYNWRQVPEFTARINSLVEEHRQSISRRAISIVERRIERLNRDWLKLQQVIEERGASAEMADVPGGTTGLIAHDVKGVGKGCDFQLIDTYKVDAPLLRELREAEKQAAIELGQWAIKGDPSDSDEALTVAEARAANFKPVGE